jgi:hypothetical protein
MSQHLLLKSFTPIGGHPQEVGTINVFIGPNNTGKSESLRDIVRLAGNFEPTGEERAKGEEPKTHVIQDVNFVSKLSMERLLRGLTIFDSGKEEGRVAHGLAPDLMSPYRRTVAGDLKNILFRPIITARSVWMTGLGDLMPLRVAYVVGEQRGRLIESTAATSPMRAPESLLAALQYADPAVHDQFDAAIAAIFENVHVRLDATERVQLSLRVAATMPPVTGNPIQDAQAFSRLRSIDSEGDGLKNVAAIVLATLLCQGRVLLLDQPEAGLHPETSRRLGTWLAENVIPLGCQIFVATRDASFISGLFSGAADVFIWRLSRRDDSTRFEQVPTEVSRALATFPLFTSQHAISCLMRDAVIVAPESADRVVYQAVAERLLRLHNFGFLHAHGARNLTFVATAFRRTNLPTCVVAELDLLQSESQFTELVKALSGNVPPAPWLATRERLVSHVEGWFNEQELSETSNEVEKFLDHYKQGDGASAIQTAPTAGRSAKLKWDRLRRERLMILPPELRIWVEELMEDLKRIGLFISPKGKLEGWIGFAADAEEPDGWLNRAMQLLHGGECPAELRAFVAEMTAQLKASSPAPRATRTSHGT